jgi:hypothetical protein
MKKWDLYKSVREEEMEAILRKQGERAAMNKRSAFRVRKQPVNPEKITRYIKEHPESSVGGNGSADIDGVIASAGIFGACIIYWPI